MKANVALIFSIIILAFVSSTSNAVLIGHWKLDEAAGVTIAVDSSTSGNDAAVIGPVVFNSNYGDFSAISGDRIELPNDPGYNTTTSFTWMARVRLTSTGTEIIMGRGDVNAGWTAGERMLRITNGIVNFQAWGGLGIAGTTLVNDGLWHHVAVTYADFSNALRLYVDGVLENVVTSGLSALSEDNTPLTIGFANTIAWYAGDIEEVRIYNEAVSTSTIETLAGLTTNNFLPTLYYWDLRSTTSMPDTDIYDYWHMAVCIQGIVNRESPRIFLIFSDNDEIWLSRLRGKGGLCEQWPTHKINNVTDYINTFKSYINGLVVYDTDPGTGVISTSLAATTAAAAEDAIAIRKDPTTILYKFLTIFSTGPQFPVLIDLTGKFTGTGTIWQTSTPSTGSAKCDAYIWAKEHYIDTNKSDPTHLNYALDLWALTAKPDPLGWKLSYLDYAIMQKAFSFELSPWGDEIPNDDPTQPLGTDLNVYKTILNACNVQTGQSELIKLTGFVNFDIKYTVNTGGAHGEVESEWEQIKLHTAYNAYTEPDTPGGTGLYTANASFYAGLKPVIEQRRYVQNPPPSYSQLQTQGLIDGSGNVPAGNYVLMFLGDYDQPATVLHWLVDRDYADPVRGLINCSWAVTPTLIERASVAMDYLYRNKTARDFFYSGASGAGYINPTQLYGTRNPSGYPTATALWQAHSRKSYRPLDYSISGWLLNGSAGNMTYTDVDVYKPFSGDGIGMGLAYDPALPSPTLRSNTVVIERLGPDDPSAGNIINNASGVHFAWYRNVWKLPSHIKAIEDTLAGSGNNHRFLDAYTFYYLLRYHLGGNNNHRATWISDTIPRIMAAGQTYPVTVTVRNDGWDTWSESGLYRLGHAIVAPGVTPATGDYDVNGRHAIAGGVTVATGAQVVFSFNIQAPAVNGNYALYYDMVHDGVTWFHQQNNIEWKKTIMVATNETDVDTDGDGVADVIEQAHGTLYWHPFDRTSCGAYGILNSDISGLVGLSDCYVDPFDLTALTGQWLNSAAGLSADISGLGQLPDNRVDLFDFSLLSLQWMQCTDPMNVSCWK